MTKAEFLLNENLLPILSRLAGDNPQPISPWAQIEPVAEMDDKAWKLLEKSGLCDGGRHLKKEVQDTIVLLHEPSRFVRLRLMNGPMIVEHIIYSCGPDQIKVSLSSSAEGLIVGSPAPLEQIMVGFLEHWGDSTLASSSLKLRLGRETSFVFAILVDLHRRDILGTWASMRDFKNREYTLDEIRVSLDDSRRDGQWLVTAVGAFAGWRKDLSVEEIKEALNFLTENEVAEEGNDGFRLANDGLSFANNFLLISQALRLEVGAQENGSEVVLSKMLCLQAGMRDHLYLEKDEDKLSVEAVSADYIVEMVDVFLAGKFVSQTFEQISEDSVRSCNRNNKNSSESSSDDDETVFKEGFVRCTVCGGVVSSSARFCNNCGISIETVPGEKQSLTEPPITHPQKRFCRHCGQQLSPAATFCGQCGEKNLRRIEL